MRVWFDDARPMPAGYDRHARSAQEAILLLQSGQVDYISLDHDLGSEGSHDSGYQVALWIEEQADANRIRVPAWGCHSANPVGRQRIEAAMRSAERRAAAGSR